MGLRFCRLMDMKRLVSSIAICLAYDYMGLFSIKFVNSGEIFFNALVFTLDVADFYETASLPCHVTFI